MQIRGTFAACPLQSAACARICRRIWHELHIPSRQDTEDTADWIPSLCSHDGNFIISSCYEAPVNAGATTWP